MDPAISQGSMSAKKSSNDSPKAEGPTYFQGWYAENGEDLNEKRRNRYENDPEYREKILAQNREARRKRSEAKLQEKREVRGSTKTNKTQSWKTVKRKRKDPKTGKTVEVSMFTIGAVAKRLGCSVQALRMWEKKGLIRKATVRAKGVRLYDDDRIELIRKQLLKQDRIKPQAKGTKTSGPPKELQYAVRMIKFPKVRKPVKTKLFKIGYLATIVGRTVVTLEQLEQRENLPATPFRASEVGYRLYTIEMMEAIKDAFDHFDGEVRGDLEWNEFYDNVFEAWTNLNVIGAWIIE